MLSDLIKQKVDVSELLNATQNAFQVVSCRPYHDKKGNLPDGITVTLMIIQDNHVYGLDKNGNPKENNLYQNFDATILNTKNTVKKGDIIRLIDFDEDHSYLINYSLILRFKDCEVIKPQGGQPNDKK